MKQIKIIHLISGLRVGGTENMLLRTLPLLPSSSHNIVCCINGDRAKNEVAVKLQAASIEVIFLNIKHPLDLGGIKHFKNLIIDFKPDLMVTYLIHADLLGRFFGRLWGVKKIICNQRGSLLNWEWLRLLDRLTSFLVTKYIVQTEVAKKKLMRKLDLSPEKFVIIPNGIDYKPFDKSINRSKKLKQLHLKHDYFNLVCVAKLRQGKGHNYLLEAFERIYGLYPRLNLLVVGDGEEEKRLIRQVREYNSRSNIYFLGCRNDVTEILGISDIFILPTLYEGMANAILEAMAAKVPVITTNIAENRAIIENGVEGLLVEPRNARKLAIALTWLIANSDLRNQLAKSAYNRVRTKFSLDQNIKNLNRLLLLVARAK